jgi:hypothetical protein
MNPRMRLVCSVSEKFDDDELVLAATESALGAPGRCDWSEFCLAEKRENWAPAPAEPSPAKKTIAQAQASFI